MGLGGTIRTAPLEDPLERLVERLELDLAHERALNAQLVALMTPSYKTLPVIPEDSPLISSQPEAISRGVRTLSHMKRRAVDILRQKEKE